MPKVSISADFDPSWLQKGRHPYNECAARGHRRPTQRRRHRPASPTGRRGNRRLCNHAGQLSRDAQPATRTSCDLITESQCDPDVGYAG